MKSIYRFLVEPKGERYSNKIKVGDKELIVNDHIFKSYMKNSFKLNKHIGVKV